MYKNILIPVLLDDDHDKQTAIEVAKTLADSDAVFTILNVREAIPTYAIAEIPQDVLAKNREEAAQSVAEIAKTLPNASGVTVSGHAGRSIVEYAAKNGTDCIILASHKPGLQNYFLGSTADRVVRHAACPVHVLR